MNSLKKTISLFLLTIISFTVVAQENSWWLNEPYRMVQTNLREIDAGDFNMDIYVESLTDMGANTVLLNVGGIVANYYTDLEYHYRNPYMKFDLIEEAISALHEAGLKVMGRFDFSKLNEEMAVKKPEWLYVNIHGETVNYNGQVHTSVNGGYQQEYAFQILSEALERFPLDGVFFNMIGYQTRDYSNNYHGIDQSDADRKAFREWSGGLDLPVKEDDSDPIFRKYRQFKAESAQDLFYRISEHIKSYGDHIALCTYTYAGIDLYRKESHGSLFSDRPAWEYSASHNVKSGLGSWSDKQVSNAAVHFLDYPARHAADARFLTEMRLVQNVMHGAGPDFYCIGRLDNLEDRRVLDHVKNAFQFHKANEHVFTGIHSDAEVLLLHDNTTEGEYRGLFEFLSERHIPFDVMEHWRLADGDIPRSLSSYKLLVLPDIRRMSEKMCTTVDDYVNKGGKILVTGFTSTADEIGNPLEKFRLVSLGVEKEFEIFEKEQGLYFRIFPADKPALANEDLEYLDLVYAWEDIALCTPKEEASAYLGFIPPAMIGPPEKCYYTEVTNTPGIVTYKYGSGSTALITFPIGSLYDRTRHYGHSALLDAAILNLLGYEANVATDASPMLELSHQVSDTGAFEWFGMVNHTGQMGNGFFEPTVLSKFTLSFKPGKELASIHLLKDGRTVEFEVNGNGMVQVEIEGLKFYDVALVTYK